jgi:3-dehydroquinate synthase
MMEKQAFRFHNSFTDFYFNGSWTGLKDIADPDNTVYITDETVHALHTRKFGRKKVIVVKAGEKFKNQQTVNDIVRQLVELKADRTTTLVGVGGGVITDITGYVGAIYMRGLKVGFVPTTILGLVDASIGGKNGVDLGLYKNMLGTIRQPDFILHDYSLLSTLPQHQWEDGFAEVIKHACIKDAALFRELQQTDIVAFRKNREQAAALIARNARIKIKVVQQDEFEQGDRKLLNFGHTIGHAIENLYKLSHGQAVALGMVYAARLSEQLTGFRQVGEIRTILEQYGLPVQRKVNWDKAFDILLKDKKKQGNSLSFILLEKIGRAVIEPVGLTELRKLVGSL